MFRALCAKAVPTLPAFLICVKCRGWRARSHTTPGVKSGLCKALPNLLQWVYMRLDSQEVTQAKAPKGEKKKRTAFLIGLGVLVLLFVGFLWQVTHYYIGIKKGTVEPPTSFLSSLTVDSSISSAIPEGEIDIDTLATLDDPDMGASHQDALLTIVEFADFGCPYSREASYIVRALAEHTDIVRYVYRDFPIVELHPGADIAAEAGECAQEQGKFFAYHDKVYQNQHDLSTASLKRYAVEIGLNSDSFNPCLDSRRYRSEVEEDRAAGIAAGVYGTPTFFFNGARIEGSIPQDIFGSLMDRFREARGLGVDS